jgi:hypothetical protein
MGNNLKGIPDHFRVGISVPQKPFILDLLPQYFNTVLPG